MAHFSKAGFLVSPLAIKYNSFLFHSLCYNMANFKYITCEDKYYSVLHCHIVHNWIKLQVLCDTVYKNAQSKIKYESDSVVIHYMRHTYILQSMIMNVL